ncbi:MAG: hypothetical protein GX804_09290, partial [Lentisphaerae bacterium]|nr:hypothetical protein [Lentisphaerota bacterium]
MAEFLESFDPYDMGKSNYYNAILQNLFFATLNCTIEKRDFSKKRKSGLTTRRGIKTFWRCYTEFSDPEAFVKLVRNVPFLNCALFECLDKEVEVEETGEMRLRLIDGFSDKKEHRAFVPNGLFFRSNETGLIDIFKRYEFTVDENTSNDADIALDPELLGKVFENLLGAYNPETRETARKATGSFYTPREIVDYMVRESLRSYLKGKVADATDEELDALFDRSPDPATGNAVLNTLRKNRERHGEYLDALYKCRILDPACGSGAFPMGILHAMTELFARLDPDNIAHLARINESYKDDKAGLKQGLSSEDLEEREEQIKERLKEGRAYPDYARKLYLIENCIYGIDIQPIATQISKLRFFISLLCDQLRTNYDAEKENFNLLSLPNLEAKFVCANSLVPLPRLPSGALDLSTGNLNELRLKLQKNRHVIFNARTATTKEKYKRIDEEIRREIKAAVKVTGAETDNEKIAYLSEQLKQLKEERSKVGEPWIEAGAAEKQTVLFDDFMTNDTPPLLHDANEKKRAELDEAIIRCEASIQKEYAKRDNRGSTELDELAELVAGWDPFDQNATSPFFDSEWMFNIKDGFDIVIGNPPYAQVLKGIYPANVFEYSEKQDKGKQNLYKLFVEFSYIAAKRTTGFVCLIVQGSLM